FAWGIAMVCAIAAIAVSSTLAYVYFQPKDEKAVRFSVPLPDKAAIVAPTGPWPAVSPDGRTVVSVMVSVGRPRLWIRHLNSLTTEAMAGTDNAGNEFPFW